METILDKMHIDLDGLFRTIKHPLVILDKDDNIVTSNDDAEFFFGLSRIEIKYWAELRRIS